MYMRTTNAVALRNAAPPARATELTLVSKGGSPKRATAVRIHTGDINHHRRMIQYGLAGSAAGCLLGLLAQGHLPVRDMLYSPIVPLSCTYIGLSLGCFIAGVQKFILEKALHRPVTTSVDTSIFDEPIVLADMESLRSTLSAHMQTGVNPEQVSVIGLDSDEFREATLPLESRKLDPLFIQLGVLGFLVGVAWGVFGCPALTPGPTAVISAFMSGFCGAILGMLCGVYIAGIVHLDNPPPTKATIIQGEVEGGIAIVTTG